MKISKLSQTLVDTFAESAMSHGWQQDQGCGSAVTNAERNFNDDKARLERRIGRLERHIKKLQGEMETMIAPTENPWPKAKLLQDQ